MSGGLGSGSGLAGGGGTEARALTGWVEALTRRPSWLAVLGVVTSALIAALPAIPAPVLTPAENRAEVRFLREMIPHHAQAVELAARIRVRSGDPALRSLALGIEQAQRAELRQMGALLRAWGQRATGAALTPEHAAGMGMATPAQLAQVQTLPVSEAERLFLRLMIRHHQGAVAMIAPLPAGRVTEEVAALARRMHAVQTDEIRQMTRLLAARGAQPWPAPATGAGQHAH